MYIEFENTIINAEIELLDMQDRIMKNSYIPRIEAGNPNCFDIEDVSSGIYILNLSSVKIAYRTKIIVQK